MEDHYEEDPLQYKTTGVAARMGDLIGLQQMVWNGRPIDVFDNRGWSPLHEAAYGGWSGCLEFLLRHPDADPDWQTHENETPILLAARGGHHQCLRALINAQADFSMATNEGFTPLTEAVQASSSECIRLLIKKGAMVNQVMFTGYTPLHHAASMGCTQIATYLLQQGARQDMRCSNGLTPLFLAVQSGNIDTVRCLLRHAHANDSIDRDVVNMAAEDNATPLLIAAQDGLVDILDLLLDHGADANIQVTDMKAGPLQFAVYRGHAKCVHKLIPVTDMRPFARDYGIMHPLVQALKLPNTKILRYLLEADLDPSGVRPLEDDQAEELHELSNVFPDLDVKASLLCHVPIDAPLSGARYLLERGLLPKGRQDNGGGELIPVVAAMIRGNFPLFCLLLQYGAKPNMYHVRIRGNVAMLYALHFDIQRSLKAGADLQQADKPVASQDNGTSSWLAQRKFSYFLRLFAAGGEVESLLRDPGSGDAQSCGLAWLLRMNLYSSGPAEGERLQRSQALGAAVLALLLCLAYNVSTVPHALLQLVSAEQASHLTGIAGKSNTLAQLGRLHVFRQLFATEGRLEVVVNSLGLPQTVCDYLLFPELAQHARTLSTLLPQKQD